MGKLIYLSHRRPDIGFVVSVICQFINNPTEKHMDVFWVLKYLKKSPGKGLCFRRTTTRNYSYTVMLIGQDPLLRDDPYLGFSFEWCNLVTV